VTLSIVIVGFHWLVMRDATVIAVCILSLLTGGGAALAQTTPQKSETEQVTEGKAIFQLYCAACHGSDARGSGPVAVDLKRPPPSLREIAKRRQGKFNEAEIRAYIDGRNMRRKCRSEEACSG
jgi:mono/diheme cytochrome c family protein